MFMTGLRAAAFAILGFIVAAPAYADAQVQNATKLWTGDLQSAYAKTVDSLSSGKIQQGKADIAKLLEYTAKMNDMTKAIADAANELAPELALNWADTQRAIYDFNEATKALAATVGKQKPDLGEMQAAKSAADGALPKSLEATKNFGKKYGELMVVVEQAKTLLGGDLSGTFTATMDYLEEGNIDDGLVALRLLRDRTTTLYQYMDIANNKATELARSLAEQWKPAYDDFKTYQVELGVLEGRVGNDEYDSEMDDIQSGFAELNSSMMTSYKEILDFGSRLVAISDDWR